MCAVVSLCTKQRRTQRHVGWDGRQAGCVDLEKYQIRYIKACARTRAYVCRCLATHGSMQSTDIRQLDMLAPLLSHTPQKILRTHESVCVDQPLPGCPDSEELVSKEEEECRSEEKVHSNSRREVLCTPSSARQGLGIPLAHII